MQQQPTQQVVVTTPQMVQQQVNLLVTHKQQQLHIKMTPIPFYFLIAVAIVALIQGIIREASGLNGAIIDGIIIALIITYTAFTIYHLEIRSDQDGLYVGFGPLQVCFCCGEFCLQQNKIPYNDIISYTDGKQRNRCWFPAGYQPGIFNENDECTNCFMNSYCRYCCCTDTWFLNGACVFLCFVLTMKNLVILNLKNPLRFCCYISPKLAISLDDQTNLIQFLRNRGIKSKQELGNQPQTIIVQQVTTQQPIISNPQEVQPMLRQNQLPIQQNVMQQPQVQLQPQQQQQQQQPIPNEGQQLQGTNY